MFFPLLWRVSLATILGLCLGYLAVRIISPASPSPTSPERRDGNFAARLSLIRQATTGELISLQIAPFEVGVNQFRVNLLDPIGQTRMLDTASLKVSQLESSDVPVEVGSTASGQSREGSFSLTGPGWWQIDAVMNSASVASFYLKLDQPSNAPGSFAPPSSTSDKQAETMFGAALSRYESLRGLFAREELASGEPGPTGSGVWFLSNIAFNRQGFHATTLGLGEGSSETYSGPTNQCVRQNRDPWTCSPGPAPLGAFDLGYLGNAIGFAFGRKEMVDGERAQVVFFYNPSQQAWYAWWVGEDTLFVRRQAMVAPGHIMLNQFSQHDSLVSIEPKELPLR